MPPSVPGARAWQGERAWQGRAPLRARDEPARCALRTLSLSLSLSLTLITTLNSNLEVLSEAKEDLNHRFARASSHMTLQLVRRLIESSLRAEVKDNPWMPRGANDQALPKP